MRRKYTSRRVHRFSSVSILSDEIAATDIAWSRDAASDMWVGGRDRAGGRDREGAFMRQLMASRRGKINRAMAAFDVIFQGLATLAAGRLACGRKIGGGRKACGRSRPR
jgi:hypothetical protein